MKQTPEQILIKYRNQLADLWQVENKYPVKGANYIKEAITALKVIGMFDYNGRKQVFNDTLDLYIKALRGKVGRGLSAKFSRIKKLSSALERIKDIAVKESNAGEALIKEIAEQAINDTEDKNKS